ncbi:L,D-transpeptidase [Rhodanobacter ginsengisoli]|uniref:L,D-transpeptidase n=1 Tax=Rhodanobacter ginsengisoli TaxID=418646 RepID=A0ABW0QT26_9GAMM
MAVACAARLPAYAGFRHLLVVLTLVIACHSATVAASPWIDSASIGLGTAKEASDGGLNSPSAEVTDLAQWVIASRNNDGMPYLVIDKVNAAVFVFDAAGHLQAAAPALLGLARGDQSVEGVGDEKMSAIRPQDRITPAGRFVASLGHDPHGKEILWVDYKDAIALHPVVKGTPRERRAERLRSPTSADNRISYGCINVPLKFYKRFVSPAFTHTSGIVYILPETSSARRLFGSGKVEPGATLSVPAQP